MTRHPTLAAVTTAARAQAAALQAAGARTWAPQLADLVDDAAWRAWDWAAGAPDPAEHILSAETTLIIAEGVGASAPGHPEVVPDLTVWLQLPAAQRRRPPSDDGARRARS